MDTLEPFASHKSASTLAGQSVVGQAVRPATRHKGALMEWFEALQCALGMEAH
jgi:hypothetical protein